MDISKLAEMLEDAADGGVSRKLAKFQAHSAQSVMTKLMERDWSALRSVQEAMRVNNLAMGRSALEDAIVNQNRLSRELSVTSAAQLALEEAKSWRATPEAMRVNNSAMGRSALEEAIANQNRLSRELSVTSAFQLALQEAKNWRTSAEALSRTVTATERFALHGGALSFAQQANETMKRLALGTSIAEASARMSVSDDLIRHLAVAVAPFSGEALATRAAWEARLSSQMKVLDRPWMLPEDPARSMLGFAHLTRLSDALRYSPPYSRDLNRFIRDELGDLVEPTGEETTDERDAAAIEAGMRPELIAFPQPAFRVVVGTAGLTLHLPPLPIPQPVEGDNYGAGFDPLVNEILCQLETRLRLLVIEKLGREAGERWLKTRVPSTVRERWRSRQAEARDKGRPVFEEIYYADLMDLEAVICRNDNWQAAFSDVFVNKEHFSLSLQHITPIRNDNAHHRPIGMAQRLRLLAEAVHILKALGIHILH